MELLVVVPTYNEADNLANLAQALLGLELDLGLLVVDDGSPDGTGEIADGLAAEDSRVNVMHRQGKLGLGSAYLQGFAWGLQNTDAALLAQMDADFSHDPARLPALVEVARRGAVAIGSRYVPGGGTRNWGLGRRVLSRGGSFYAGLILGLGIRDVTGGFKVWPRAVLQAMNLGRVGSGGYVFQAEMSYRARRAGARLEEVPIIFEDRRVGESKMSTAIALEAVWRVWQVRLTD